MSLLANIEKKIVDALIQEKHTDIEREKLAFGVKLIINDLWKLLIVYMIAIWLDCFFLTIFTHVVFFLLRNVAFGFHFENNFICLISSILALPIGISVIDEIALDSTIIIAITLFATILLIVFAPSGTKKRPIFNDNHKRYLKKKMYIRLAILWLAFIIVSEDLQKFIAYGMILQVIAVLTQKIVGGLENVQNFSNKNRAKQNF